MMGTRSRTTPVSHDTGPALVPHGTPEAPVPVFFLISLLVAGVALCLLVRRRRTTAAADQILRDGAP